jgi:hypothetical protein
MGKSGSGKVAGVGNMSEFKCPKCGGGIHEWARPPVSCEVCGEVYDPDWLEGYWTAKAEEEAKRCDGCKHWYDFECALLDIGTNDDFRCAFWTPNV